MTKQSEYGVSQPIYERLYINNQIAFGIDTYLIPI